MKPERMDGAPYGAISACHKSGWMQLSVFSDWFDNFIEAAGASQDNEVLLILDGIQHIHKILISNKGRENGIYLLSPTTLFTQAAITRCGIYENPFPHTASGS